MIPKKNELTQTIALFYVFSFFLSGCVDPVEPEFQITEGLVFIDGLASNLPGTSFVTVSESVLDNNRFSRKFISEANVSFKNVNTGEVISLIEQEDSYVPSSEFEAVTGDTFELNITLPDGKQYQSLQETITAPVPISEIGATYDPKLVFREASEGFVPGHRISVNFNDPPGEKNYYYWRFSSFENLPFCEICENSIFRNGICEDNPPVFPNPRKSHYMYACATKCWKIRFNEKVQIFSDEFTNGSFIRDLPVGDVLLYTKENIVVELQQFSLSSAAHGYYKVLRDIVNNSGGLNAPPPAALIGNMFSINDSDEFVLGRFTAAAASTESIFIDRIGIGESQIEQKLRAQFEQMGEVPGPEITIIPCEESRERTAMRPQGWIDPRGGKKSG